MVTSRGAVFLEKGKPLVVEALEYGDPGPDEVLVKNFYSGICHSQLHQMHGTLATPGPTLLGHESTGEVVAAGRNVRHVQKGDKVFVTWLPRDAKAGQPMPAPVGNIGWRGQKLQTGVYTWAEHSLAHGDFVVKVPKDIPNDVTSIIGCAVMTGAGAVLNTANVQKGQSAAVFGIGGVGMSAITALAVRGADPIIAVDLDDAKLEFAKKFGATITINARREDPIARIKQITGPKGRVDFFGNPISGLEFAFDCIGVNITIKQIVDAVRPADWTVTRGGTAVLVGVPQGEATINAVDLLIGEKRLIGSIGGSCRPERDFPEFIRWYKEGMLDLDALVTERTSLAKINEACDRLQQGKVFGRSIIEF